MTRPKPKEKAKQVRAYNKVSPRGSRSPYSVQSLRKKDRHSSKKQLYGVHRRRWGEIATPWASKGNRGFIHSHHGWTFQPEEGV